MAVCPNEMVPLEVTGEPNTDDRTPILLSR
jgi:hypothetical protein